MFQQITRKVAHTVYGLQGEMVRQMLHKVNRLPLAGFGSEKISPPISVDGDFLLQQRLKNFFVTNLRTRRKFWASYQIVPSLLKRPGIFRCNNV